MARYSRFPILYDSCKYLSISDLKRWGYLKPDQDKWGTITWSRQGNKIGSISISVNTRFDSPYIELDYKCKDDPINYRIYFALIPSNLGKGFIWFFICPETGKYCRKLYLINNYFYHRTAFGVQLYEKQTYGHKARWLDSEYDKLNRHDKAFEAMYSKYFRKCYRGKPTKRYLKVLKDIKVGDQISIEQLLHF